MKKIIYIFLVSIIISCSAKNKVAEPLYEALWSYSPNAIEIRYKSSKHLNIFNNYPHTILLMVFQMEDNTDFSSITTSKEGISKLLATNIETTENQLKIKGLIKYNRFIISPDQYKILSIDREKNTKWIGIIAGYYNLDPANTEILSNSC